MTFEDFEKAKVIQHKLALIGANKNVLNHIIECDTHRSSSTEYAFVLDGDTSERLVMDIEFINKLQSYYSNYAAKLNAEFEALGKEINK